MCCFPYWCVEARSSRSSIPNVVELESSVYFASNVCSSSKHPSRLVPPSNSISKSKSQIRFELFTNHNNILFTHISRKFRPITTHQCRFADHTQDRGTATTIIPAAEPAMAVRLLEEWGEGHGQCTINNRWPSPYSVLSVLSESGEHLSF